MSVALKKTKIFLVCFLSVVAITAGAALEVRAVEPLSKIPQFYTSNSWVVSPVKALVERGIHQPGCVMANQFNNGFIVRFIGGQGQLYSMSVDFRQDVFQNGNAYGVQLRLGKGYAGQITAKAQGSSTLVLPMQEKKVAYDALSQASLIDVGLEGSVLRFQLNDIQSSMRRMESCANPVRVSDRNANQLFPEGLLEQSSPIGYTAPNFAFENTSNARIVPQAATSELGGMTVKGVRQKEQSQGIAYNSAPLEPETLHLDGARSHVTDPHAYISRQDALPIIPSETAQAVVQQSDQEAVLSHYVPGSSQYTPGGKNVGALSGQDTWQSAIEKRNTEIQAAQLQELQRAAEQEPLAVSNAVTTSGQIESNFRQARENNQDETFVGLRVGEVESAHTGGGPHGAGFGELGANVFLDLQEIPKGPFFSVVRAGGVPRGGADALVFFPDEVLVAQRFPGAVSPFLAHPLMQAFGKGLRQPVGERLDHDGGVIIVLGFKRAGPLIGPGARR